MGTLFRRTANRPLPKTATVTEKNGKLVARWRSRGRWQTAPVVEVNGVRTVTVELGNYYARFRDGTGQSVERSTGCRDETNARQLLARWEREAEQIHAGVLDAGALSTARAAGGPIESAIEAYEQSLLVAEVSQTYRTNAVRAIRRLHDELGLEVVRDLRRDRVESWFATAIAADMSAAARNYYRQSIVSFANWLVQTKRLRESDLAGLPVADRRSDPRRQRRALTPDEITRLLEVAARRPLDDARTVRRGERKGQAAAELRPEVVARLLEVGRERALVYRTLVYTGLRVGELRTLTVARLSLTEGAECVELEAANEKNRAGSTLPLRADLAADLRAWIAEKRLAPADLLFTVPAGLRRILDRDLAAAGIPKRDERNRTVDVHAMRTTFGTLLSATGTAPRTAQAAMRHADIKLTMNTYTDPKLLDVRKAVERLPALAPRGANTEGAPESAHESAGTDDPKGQFVALPGTIGTMAERLGAERAPCENAGNVNEKPSLTITVSEGHGVERRRVELPTSSLRTWKSDCRMPAIFRTFPFRGTELGYGMAEPEHSGNGTKERRPVVLAGEGWLVCLARRQAVQPQGQGRGERTPRGQGVASTHGR